MLEEENPKWGGTHSASLTATSWHRAKKWWLRLISTIFSSGGKPSHSAESLTAALLLTNAENTTVSLQEQLKLLDQLQIFIQTLREQVNPRVTLKVDIDMLGASTYLHHIERLIVKMREQLFSFRYRCEQFSPYKMLEKKEFAQVVAASQLCYQSLLVLRGLLEKLNPQKLYSQEFINAANTLELRCEELCSAMRQLNQLAYRHEALLQLSQLEHQVIQNLLQSQTQKSSPTFNEMLFASGESKGISGDYLRTKLSKTMESEHSVLLSKVIDTYDTLKKCYVIARKILIKETLDKMAIEIESLIEAFSQSQPDKEAIYNNLYQYFNYIESLRFSTNRESRCSRNLFEKARLARRQLRKACAMHSWLGREFLNKIAVKRENLIRETKKFK